MHTHTQNKIRQIGSSIDSIKTLQGVPPWGTQACSHHYEPHLAIP